MEGGGDAMNMKKKAEGRLKKNEDVDPKSESRRNCRNETRVGGKYL